VHRTRVVVPQATLLDVVEGRPKDPIHPTQRALRLVSRSRAGIFFTIFLVSLLAPSRAKQNRQAILQGGLLGSRLFSRLLVLRTLRLLSAHHVDPVNAKEQPSKSNGRDHEPHPRWHTEERILVHCSGTGGGIAGSSSSSSSTTTTAIDS